MVKISPTKPAQMSEKLFVTRLYKARIPAPKGLEETCLGLAMDDRAGRRWSRDHGYGGYTSYASLNDLTRRASIFAELERGLSRHAAAFARELQFDLAGRKLALDSLWVNVMNKGAIHAPHIHPHSVISGTYYVAVPPGSGVLRFEDPRLPLMMAAPPRKAKARPENRLFVDVTPKPGMLLLWESWLRHGVETNRARGRRISVSFNYRFD
jgi:uncharacterized protein (TIGR02466 family)